MKKTLIMFTLLLIVTLGFALESTLTYKGGIAQAQTDIDDENQMNGMIGLSYEIWLAKWISLGLHPYVTRFEAGPNDDVNFKANVIGGDMLFRLRPNWRPIAPYLTVGGGISDFYPKTSEGQYITGTDHTVGVLPAVGAGLMFFTKYDIDFELGFQNEFLLSDHLDGWETDDNNDSYWMAFLGISHTFGKVKKVVEPEPVPVVEPVVEVPEPVLTVAPNSHKAGWQAGTAKTKIEANNPWNARTDSNWIRINPTSGNGNAMLNVSYDENPGYEPRSGKIFISSADLNQVITVWQEGKPIPSLVLKPVFFEFDKYDLTDTAIATLDEVLASMAYYPETQLLLSGNADEKGSLKYNQKLSEKRADAVKQYLISKGIAAERLSTIGYGKTKPIADNSTEEGRAQNRRTDLTLVK